MSRFLQEEAILDVLEAEYESSCSEIEDVENVSIHETDSEEDTDLYDHQSHELPLPPLAQPLGVRNWRDLQFPMEDAVICHACYTLLQNAEVITPRLLGHSHVCAGCGCSLTGIRLHRLEANSPLVEYYPWIRSIQNHRSDYEVCHNCWRRVSRHVGMRQSAQDAQRQVVLDVNQEVAPPVLPAPPQGQRNVEASSVYLPHYKRAANTSRHCIYTNCDALMEDFLGWIFPSF
ncbi:hypothetical protein ACJJTC_009261 [Scirpophaga incertulas]